jgi:hypothetical protein
MAAFGSAPGAGDQRVEPAMGAPVGKAPGPVGQLEVGLDQRQKGSGWA